MSIPDRAPRLLGRSSECAALDELVAGVRAGASRALVLRGEAGVGKSALLEYLARGASGCAIARAAGVEAEVELAFAGQGVHQARHHFEASAPFGAAGRRRGRRGRVTDLALARTAGS